MKRLFLMILVFLFPYLGFADDWVIFNTNKDEYHIGFILHETDIINIQDGEFLMIRNIEKKQIAVIVIPGEKTLKQGIEEAKELERKKNNITDRNGKHLWEPSYLLFMYPNYMRFWIQVILKKCITPEELAKAPRSNP